jgi:hypothetical protein
MSKKTRAFETTLPQMNTAPLDGVIDPADDAVSNYLPGVVDAAGTATRGAREAAKLDGAAVAPLDGVIDPADDAVSNYLPDTVDADGNVIRGTRRPAQINDVATTPFDGVMDPADIAVSYLEMAKDWLGKAGAVNYAMKGKSSLEIKELPRKATSKLRPRPTASAVCILSITLSISCTLADGTSRA